MIFLLDANIPPSLKDDISGHEVIHVLSFPDGNSTKDKLISDFSFENNCVLITKDSDFYNSFVISKKPPKLILVKLGNIRLRELRKYFRVNWNLIEYHLQKYSLIVLTQESIQVFE